MIGRIVMDVSKLTRQEVAKMLDYSLVTRPELPSATVMEAMEHVKKYKFGGFALLPYWMPLVIETIGDFCKENKINIVTGIGFPFGTSTTKSKLFEAEEMIKLGVGVLDIVTNVISLKEKKYSYYQNELKQLAKLCMENNIKTRAIAYVGYLTDEEIKTATKIISDSEIDFVKTETGLGMPGRPNIHDVCLILETLEQLKTNCKLKATSGRVSDVYAFIQAGAAVIGTNIGPEVVESLPMVQKLLFKK
jgi:deoxyribose-phosphate aldolase